MIDKELRRILKNRFRRAVVYEAPEGQKGIDIEVERTISQIKALYNLPSKSEIEEILKTPNFDVTINDLLRKDIVTAIHNRIHKEGG